MGLYAHQSSSVDDNNTNKDGQWTTDYPVSSTEAFQFWWANKQFCDTKN